MISMISLADLQARIAQGALSPDAAIARSQDALDSAETIRGADDSIEALADDESQDDEDDGDT